eukprot:6929396-Pyramimonas_sp.AAC.1
MGYCNGLQVGMKSLALGRPLRPRCHEATGCPTSHPKCPWTKGPYKKSSWTNAVKLTTPPPKT